MQAQGYTGSQRSLYRRLGRWREGPRRRGTVAAHPAPPRSPLDDLTPGQVIGWIIARQETLTLEAAARLEGLCQLDPVIAQARDLAQRWLGFIRTHTSEGLDIWLEDMRASSIPAFVSFARSVERDKAAIMAGLTLPYSTGPVEGHISASSLSNGKPTDELGLLTCNAAFCLLLERSSPQQKGGHEVPERSLGLCGLNRGGGIPAGPCAMRLLEAWYNERAARRSASLEGVLSIDECLA